MTLSSIAMSHSGRMLFTGTSAGSIRSMKFPLTVPGEWTDYQAHSAPIVKVCISTASYVLAIFKLQYIGRVVRGSATEISLALLAGRMDAIMSPRKVLDK